MQPTARPKILETCYLNVDSLLDLLEAGVDLILLVAQPVNLASEIKP